MPPKEGNKYIPDFAGMVATAVICGELPIDQMMFCIYVKGASEVPQTAIDDIKETFADEKYKLQVGKSVDLWHSR